MPGEQVGVERSGSGSCSDCGSLTYSRQWEAAFGVRLCNDCRAGYTLISKGNAKQRYAVTDADLKRLGTLEKPNPQYKNGAPMRLLLECQVEEASLAKHGDEGTREALIEERQQAKSGPAKAAKAKQAERKAAALRARIAGARKRVSAAAPRLSTLLSPGGGCGGAGASATEDVEEI